MQDSSRKVFLEKSKISEDNDDFRIPYVHTTNINQNVKAAYFQRTSNLGLGHYACEGIQVMSEGPPNVSLMTEVEFKLKPSQSTQCWERWWALNLDQC